MSCKEQMRDVFQFSCDSRPARIYSLEPQSSESGGDSALHKKGVANTFQITAVLIYGYELFTTLGVALPNHNPLIQLISNA
jgi:hypothetical protein